MASEPGTNGQSGNLVRYPLLIAEEETLEYIGEGMRYLDQGRYGPNKAQTHGEGSLCMSLVRAK